MSIFPAPFIEEAVFVPLYILASFVKNKIPIGAWVYFWAFFLVLFAYISVFVPVPYCLPRSKHLLISWLISPSAVILEPPPKKKSDTVSTVSPSISHEMMGPDAMIFFSEC